MAPYGSDDSRTVVRADGPHASRRTAARYGVPVAVVGVAAATIGLVPALADSGDPDLPKVTAQQLVEKIAQSDVEQLSGTVRVSADLGLPDLGGLGLPDLGHLASGAVGPGGASADPSAGLTALVSGTHTVRVAADGPDRQKVSLTEGAATYSLIHNGKDVWGYDSTTGEVHHGTADHDGTAGRHEAPATPEDFADKALKSVDDTTSVTVDGTAQVAGRDAYKLVIKPSHAADSTVGAISIAVDARTGLPLKFTLTPVSGGAAVLDVGFTRVSFAEPDASVFDFTPPKGAKVIEEKDAGAGRHAPGHGAPRGVAPQHGPAKSGVKVIGRGWNSIATFDTGVKGGLRVPSSSGSGGPSGFLGSLGDPVSGTFGRGTVFSTRLVNALITDDGTVYAGAVTKEALVKAANAVR